MKWNRVRFVLPIMAGAFAAALLFLTFCARAVELEL